MKSQAAAAFAAAGAKRGKRNLVGRLKDPEVKISKKAAPKETGVPSPSQPLSDKDYWE